MPSLHLGRLAVLALAFLLTITRGSALAAPDTTIESGPAAQTSIFLKGRGLPLPDPPMPFTQQPTITVQVVNGAGTCWGAAYVVAPRVNTEQKLLVEEKPYRRSVAQRRHRHLNWRLPCDPSSSPSSYF
jgi:hypothetical protein